MLSVHVCLAALRGDGPIVILQQWLLCAAYFAPDKRPGAFSGPLGLQVKIGGVMVSETRFNFAELGSVLVDYHGTFVPTVIE